MKWFLRILVFLLTLVILVVGFVFYHVRDRHPGYEVDLDIYPLSTYGKLQAGFAAIPITPSVNDTWIDENNDARFNEKDGDRYKDRNQNGRFDSYWMAGFNHNRPAAGVHDDLWARAMVVDDGQTRLALVVLDVIGFMHNDVIDVRHLIPKDLNINYTIVCSTHNHEAPDLIGIWGKNPFKSGVNREYLKFVKRQAANVIMQAFRNLRPAKFRFAQDLEGARALVTDTRRPYVLDPGLRLMQAIDAHTGMSLGVIVSWANHPETLWSKNLLISSDFPHYVREAIEKGIYDGNRLVMPGLGGVVIYINGAIGGLMTTPPDFAVNSPFSDTFYMEPSFEKANAQGHFLAKLSLQALQQPSVVTIERGGIRLRARTILVPVDNNIFRLAAALKVIDRGFTNGLKIRTELAAWRLGSASFIAIPGEIYPEMINGGIETPVGRDFNTKAMELPPLRELMPGEFRFVIGLANDEIGYIIPKSEWDEDPPYLYDAKSSPYGEINSTGPEAGPIVHKMLHELIEDL